MSTHTIEPPAGRELPRTSSETADDHSAAHAMPKSVVREYFESGIVTIIMALFGMTFIVQAVKVPTGSMQNTINIGDQLLVNKFVFAPGPVLPLLPQREVKRGDVIVFKYPGNHDNPIEDLRSDSRPFSTNYVKRVVGLPGDTVEVRGDAVYINGKLLPERRVSVESSDVGSEPETKVVDFPPPAGDGPYTVYYDQQTREEVQRGEQVLPPSSFTHGIEGSPVTVPANHYFVMGDNRDNSTDSRAWGFVPRDLVVGQAMLVYWSYDMSDTSEGNPLVRFFRNSRWGRTGKMIE